MMNTQRLQTQSCRIVSRNQSWSWNYHTSHKSQHENPWSYNNIGSNLVNQTETQWSDSMRFASKACVDRFLLINISEKYQEHKRIGLFSLICLLLFILLVCNLNCSLWRPKLIYSSTSNRYFIGFNKVKFVNILVMKTCPAQHKISWLVPCKVCVMIPLLVWKQYRPNLGSGVWQDILHPPHTHKKKGNLKTSKNNLKLW